MPGNSDRGDILNSKHENATSLPGNPGKNVSQCSERMAPRPRVNPARSVTVQGQHSHQVGLISRRVMTQKKVDDVPGKRESDRKDRATEREREREREYLSWSSEFLH